jgi:hypothetical protein
MQMFLNKKKKQTNKQQQDLEERGSEDDGGVEGSGVSAGELAALLFALWLGEGFAQVALAGAGARVALAVFVAAPRLPFLLDSRPCLVVPAQPSKKSRPTLATRVKVLVFFCVFLSFFFE